MIRGANVVRRLLTIMPAQESVTLKSRNAGETASTDVTYTARRKPARKNELLLAGAVLGQQWITFQLYVDAQTNYPKVLDGIVDVAALRWEIKQVETKQQGYVFNCLCIKDIV